jgi:L-asparaginase/Glu-tRNA(Gln) amidotransferase subunit D
VHAMRRRFTVASRGVGSNSMKRALWQEIAQQINANVSVVQITKLTSRNF